FVPRAATRKILPLRSERVPLALDQPHERHLALQPLELLIRDACHRDLSGSAGGFAFSSVSARAARLPPPAFPPRRSRVRVRRCRTPPPSTSAHAGAGTASDRATDAGTHPQCSARRRR